MYSSNDFRPGDVVTPKGSCAYSRNYVKLVFNWEKLTIQKVSLDLFTATECPSFEFATHDFRKVRSSTHTEPVAPVAPDVQFEVGDTVTPRDQRGAVSTNDDVRITFGRTVTANAITLVPVGEEIKCFFTIEEGFGIFFAGNFKKSHNAPSKGSTTTREMPLRQENTPRESPAKSHNETDSSQEPSQKSPLTADSALPTRKRKLKRHFEKKHGPLKWEDGYLCLQSTGKKIPNSPYRPD